MQQHIVVLYSCRYSHCAMKLACVLIQPSHHPSSDISHTRSQPAAAQMLQTKVSAVVGQRPAAIIASGQSVLARSSNKVHQQQVRYQRAAVCNEALPGKTASRRSRRFMYVPTLVLSLCTPHFAPNTSVVVCLQGVALQLQAARRSCMTWLRGTSLSAQLWSYCQVLLSWLGKEELDALAC